MFEALEKLGVVSQLRRDQIIALERIENAGGVGLLTYQAARLRESGDPTAIVAESTYGRHVMVQLLYGLKKNDNLHSSHWSSIGVAIEATLSTPLSVRMTGGSSWDYLSKYCLSDQKYGWQIMLEQNSGLTPTEIDMIRHGLDGVDLETQVKLAMKISRTQADYRYGEGEVSKKAQLRHDAHFRMLFPKRKYYSPN